MNINMLNINSTRAEIARRYLAFRTAFGLNTDANPVTSEQAAKAALAEAVAEHASGANGLSLAEVFTLAEAVLQKRDDVAAGAPAEYDIDSLAVACGSRELAILAVKLCGAYVQNGRHWIDDGVGDPVVVTFPEEFFRDFLSEWVVRV